MSAAKKAKRAANDQNAVTADGKLNNKDYARELARL